MAITKIILYLNCQLIGNMITDNANAYTAVNKRNSKQYVLENNTIHYANQDENIGTVKKSIIIMRRRRRKKTYKRSRRTKITFSRAKKRNRSQSYYGQIRTTSLKINARQATESVSVILKRINESQRRNAFPVINHFQNYRNPPLLFYGRRTFLPNFYQEPLYQPPFPPLAPHPVIVSTLHPILSMPLVYQPTKLLKPIVNIFAPKNILSTASPKTTQKSEGKVINNNNFGVCGPCITVINIG